MKRIICVLLAMLTMFSFTKKNKKAKIKGREGGNVDMMHRTQTQKFSGFAIL